MVTDLTKLNLNQIIYLLKETGYDSNEIFSVSYVSTTNHTVKYMIKYNDYGVMETGYIYLYIDNSGKLVAEY